MNIIDINKFVDLCFQSQWRIIEEGRIGEVKSMWRPFAFALPTQPLSPTYNDAGNPRGSDGDPPTMKSLLNK